jgi:hypothetical protein
VAQVVDPDIFDPGAGADTLPERLQVAEWLALQGASNNPRVAINALGIPQVFDGWRADMDELLASF